MHFDVIAACAPETVQPLCQSLMPHAGAIRLRIITDTTNAEAALPRDFTDAAVVHRTAGQALAATIASVVQSTEASYLVFLSGVTGLQEGWFDALTSALDSSDEATCFECRSLPNEPEHHIDPVTLQSPTVGGTACVIPRSLYEEAGGLDIAMPPSHMWDELSLRLRAAGGKIFYLPGVCCFTQPAEEDDAREAYLASQLYKLQFACKYGDSSAISAARREYWAAVRTPQPFPNVRRLLVEGYRQNLTTLSKLKRWRKENTALFERAKTIPQNGLVLRRGVSLMSHPVEKRPAISIVIRTHNRANQLRCALQSVANQTLPAHEIVVVEDGAATAREMIAQEFSHLPIVYVATESPVGRSRAGNMGLAMATGEYLNFLDDDDLFYPDHLEQMAAQIIAHPDADLILGCSVSMFTDRDSAQPETREAARYELVRFDRLDVFTMCQMCQIPILSVAFKKALFTELGGLHEGMDAHEDWAMWLKYLGKARRIHPDKIDIPRATSVFLQPAAPQEAARRMDAYHQFDQTLFTDPDIRFTVSLADMRGFYDGVLADIQHVKQLGQLEEFLQRETNRDKQG